MYFALQNCFIQRILKLIGTVNIFGDPQTKDKGDGIYYLGKRKEAYPTEPSIQTGMYIGWARGWD